MENLMIFKNENFGEIRTVKGNGKVLFCGSDVAKALGYADTQKAIKQHCKEDGWANYPVIDSLGRTQQAKFINEGNLYRLIAHSKLESAEKFEKWVFDEVLPSIRQNGGYLAGQEDMSEDEIMAKAILFANKKIENLKKDKEMLEMKNSQLAVANEIMKPKADYFDELVDRNLLTNFTATAKEFKIKRKDLIQFLLDKKYIYRDKKGNLQPYAEKNNGLFEIKESTNNKTSWAGTQTLITPKGRETFRILCQGL